jgi:RNA polymerase sigma-70 factor (ECF subfamily)
MSTLAIDRGTVSIARGAPKPIVQTVAVPVSEAELELRTIKAVLAGDTDAFRPLVEAHQSRVYHLALRMLANEREAEDVAQDAFLHAFARLASYRPEWRFKTWIMSIASNLCIDRLRRHRLEPTSFADFATRTAHGEEAEVDFVSGEPGPEAIYSRKQRNSAVQAMLDELPIADRSMIVMFYFSDMSYDEIAKATNSTVSAVKSRLFRARQKMSRSAWADQVM